MFDSKKKSANHLFMAESAGQRSPQEATMISLDFSPQARNHNEDMAQPHPPQHLWENLVLE